MTAAPTEIFNRSWDLALLIECFEGVSRFDDFHRRLGLSRQTLAHRLRSLVEDELLVRTRYQTRPDRFEYGLTQKGRELLPVVMAIRSWGERWGRAAWRVEHLLCGRRCSATVICAHCADPVRLEDVRIVPNVGDPLKQPGRSR